MTKNYRAELVGVFGDPVEGNPTGVLEEAGFAALGLNYRYLTMKVTPEDFDAAMKSLKALNMKGINLTMPHKITVLPYLDEISQAARIIGAVNTIVIRNGKLIGDNTDGKGFVQALEREHTKPEGKSITILGADDYSLLSLVLKCISKTKLRKKSASNPFLNSTPILCFSFFLL